MTMIVLALLFGIALIIYLIRDFATAGGLGFRGLDSHAKICKILKILLTLETAAFVVIFAIVLAKTLFM